MPDMTNIQNPTTLSDYDWLEFEGFVCKVDGEGFTYAYENYSPDFEAPDMQEFAADMGKFRAYYQENAGLVEEWWDTVGGDLACDLHNAHVDESRKRQADARDLDEKQPCGESGCLCYGVGPDHAECACGCDCPRDADGQLIHEG